MKTTKDYLKWIILAAVVILSVVCLLNIIFNDNSIIKAISAAFLIISLGTVSAFFIFNTKHKGKKSSLFTQENFKDYLLAVKLDLAEEKYKVIGGYARNVIQSSGNYADCINDTAEKYINKNQHDIFFTQTDIGAIMNYLTVADELSYKYDSIQDELCEVCIKYTVTSRINEISPAESVMTLKLQRKDDTTKQSSHDSDENTKTEAKSRILLVEDNKMNRELVVHMLSGKDYLIDTAENGQVALDLIYSHPADYYTLILTDIHMPKVDGYELAQEIRSSHNPIISKLPMIAMTGSTLDEDIEEVFYSGMNEFIPKPIEYDRLIMNISKVIYQRGDIK